MAGTVQSAAGAVVALWRYPVKSMLGEELNAAEVTERGLLGDRVFALMDRSTGKVASAKHLGKWSRFFECRAAFFESPQASGTLPPVRITLPDGSMASSAQSDIDQILTRVLGREVTLLRTAPKAPRFEEYWPDINGLPHRETVTDEALALSAPEGTFFDAAVVHLLTTATIDRLRELYPSGRFEVRRFRPNLVVQPASDQKDFVENAWIGRTVAIGDAVRLNIIDPCPRCVMTTLAQADLPKDPGILRTVVQHSQAKNAAGDMAPGVVGVYASVLQGGTVRRGDTARLE